MQPEEAFARLEALGFDHGDALTLWEHFDDAEQRGKQGHGHSHIPWLEQLEGFDPEACPIRVEEAPGYWRVDANNTIGYVALRSIVEWQIEEQPAHARLVVVERCFPTGMLGHYARRLANAGFVSMLTATSPARLGPPGGPKVAGTNPLAIGVPGDPPVVVDVSMGAVTYGDVIAGLAQPDELVPFGGEQWHKAFALALGLQLLVDALHREPGFGAVLLVARPESDPVSALRATGIRLPGSGGRP